MKINIHSLLSGQKCFLSPARAMFAALALFLTLGAAQVSAAVTNLVFNPAPPSSTVAGVAFSPDVKVEFQIDGVLDTTATSNVVLTLTTGAGTLTGTRTNAAVAGVATFSGLKIDKIGANKVLTATARTSAGASITKSTAAFEITLAPVSMIRVETASSGNGVVVPVQNLYSHSSLTVYAITRDAYSNFWENAIADSWTFTPGGGVVVGDLVAAGDMKSAVLTGDKIGTAASIAAASGALTQTKAGTITIIRANRTVTFTPICPQAYNTTNNLSDHAIYSAGTGSYWTFTVPSGPGTGKIVDPDTTGSNLWMTGRADITVRALINQEDTYASAYADAVVSFGNNVIPGGDNFDTLNQYTNLTPLINGTNGWYSSFSGTNNEYAIVQEEVKNSAPRAAKIPTDISLDYRFVGMMQRIVKLEMYIQPQLYSGTNPLYPSVLTNVAAQFYVNSNGYFVVCNGTNWQTVTTMADGREASSLTNTTYFTKVQVNLRYKNHTWNLKAWTNDADYAAGNSFLVASTYYMNFTSNLDTFNGFNIYNGTSTSYLDNVSVDIGSQSIINGVPFDSIKSINGAQPPSVINGK